jgi:hypothetical protein
MALSSQKRIQGTFEIVGAELPVPSGSQKNYFGVRQVLLCLFNLRQAWFVRPLCNTLLVKPGMVTQLLAVLMRALNVRAVAVRVHLRAGNWL